LADGYAIPTKENRMSEALEAAAVALREKFEGAETARRM
jgi:hypothetical protein